MLIRIWKSEIKPGHESDFTNFMISLAKDILEKQPGCLSWFAGRSDKNGKSIFVVVTVWKDKQSLVRFTGPNWTEARIDADEVLFLNEKPNVEHYESL
jgi:quinol monooxygenase YgiN